MRTARRSTWEQGIRINYVAPCWIKSAIRTAEYEKWLVDRGIEFGEPIDVSSCFMRVATDKAVNGKLSILAVIRGRKFQKIRWADVGGIGRTLMITPRSIAQEGFMDIDREDYGDGPEDAYLKKTQETQLVIIEDKWRDDYKVRVYKD